MPAIYMMTFLVLIGSDILLSKVDATSSNSYGSKDSDEKYCQHAVKPQEAIRSKSKSLNNNNGQSSCKCGNPGTISKIDIIDAKNGTKSTIVTCFGCPGPQVLITSAARCNIVLEVLRPHINVFCQLVIPRCKNVTIYSCGCPVSSTTPARTTLPLTTTRPTVGQGPVTTLPQLTTTSVPLSPVQTTTSATSPTNTSMSIVTKKPTPILQSGYNGYTGYYSPGGGY